MDMDRIRSLFGSKISVGGQMKECNVVAVLGHADGTEEYIAGANLVTDEGDKYYASGAVGSPSWAVAGMRLGTGSNAPAKGNTDVQTFLAGSGKAVDAGYPKISDDDADNVANAGIKVVTWRVSYATGEANGTGINELALVDNITTPTKALNRALFGEPFNKTSSDTLKVFVNHSFNGVP
jgi:hypothetical protein